MKHSLSTHTHNLIIVGSGGAGLMAALKARKRGYSVACVSKTFPTHSHTVAAQGGINAALSNIDPDNVQWHMYDTIRGSDWLADQDAVEYMCQQAPHAIRSLEQLGVPFSRHSNGKLDQRVYGGQSSNFGKGPSPHRACFAADRTGHAILHTLYQQCLKENVTFFNYHMATDLLMHEGTCYGVLAWDMEQGSIKALTAPSVILATGGYGQIYQTTTSSSICTGDGAAMIARSGLPLQDMEFIQFHPTGIYGSGFLITEAARAEGAYLTNAAGKRFMEDYAPHYLDLAPRDVIARAIATELMEGRGCGTKKDHVLLHLEHLPPYTIEQRLPEIKTLAATYAHIDITKHPVPVVPSVHYTMGGIPTNLQGQVMKNDHDTVPGLYAIGEAACVSIHGANRLGCNSLLDLIVFGSATIDALPPLPSLSQQVPTAVITAAHHRVLKLVSGKMFKDIPPVSTLRAQIQHILSSYAGIFRTHDVLTEGLNQILPLLKQSTQLVTSDRSLCWNQELSDIIEVQNMALLGYMTLHSALSRTESRGAHYRQDYPTRNDTAWLMHSLASITTSYDILKNKRPVRMHLFTPEARKY